MKTFAAIALALFSVGTLATVEEAPSQPSSAANPVPETPAQPPPPPAGDNRPPYHVPNGNPNLNYHMVVFHDNHTLEHHTAALGLNISDHCTDFQYYPNFPAYRGQFNHSVIHDIIRNDPGVRFVERDTLLRAPDVDAVPAENRTSEPDVPPEGQGLTKRTNSKSHISNQPKHLKLISYRPNAHIRTPVSQGTYYFWDDDAEVDIYVMNGGVQVTHPEFGGRAHHFPTMIAPGFTTKYCDTHISAGRRSLHDAEGHGTAVASAAGGRNVGVSKNAAIWNVKVSCGSHFSNHLFAVAMSDIGAMHAHKFQRTNRHRYKGAIINVSLTINDDNVFRSALLGLHNQHVMVTYGPPNDGGIQINGMCDFPNFICTANVDAHLTRNHISPWGPRMKVAALGTDLVLASTHAMHSTGYATWTGTSFAAPQVAGVFAQMLGKYGNGRTAVSLTFQYQKLYQWCLHNRVAGFVHHVPMLLNNDAQP